MVDDPQKKNIENEKTIENLEKEIKKLKITNAEL